MALYEYMCKNCGVMYPIEHSVNESPELSCKLCESEMRKVYSSPVAIFPGDGWGKDAR